MPSRGGLTRRSFITATLGAGGALLVGVSLSACESKAVPESSSLFAPNAFVRIGTDSRVTLVMPRVEMGQGTYTALPMLIAEELEVDLAHVRLEHAPADDQRYVNPALGFQVTGGSTSIRSAWEPMRRAGAAARTLLVDAAAQTWGVAPASCRAEHGAVLHPPSGRRLAYGELVGKAATLPVPKDVALKDPGTFKLIGTPVHRLDGPDKVNGQAIFGLDARVAGMRVAAVITSPVIGGRVADVDDSAA